MKKTSKYICQTRLVLFLTHHGNLLHDFTHILHIQISTFFNGMQTQIAVKECILP